MSVRFTPGLDDLVHPVRDAKLLAQFWPFFLLPRASPCAPELVLAGAGGVGLVVLDAARTVL